MPFYAPIMLSPFLTDGPKQGLLGRDIHIPFRDEGSIGMVVTINMPDNVNSIQNIFILKDASVEDKFMAEVRVRHRDAIKPNSGGDGIMWWKQQK